MRRRWVLPLASLLCLPPALAQDFAARADQYVSAHAQAGRFSGVVLVAKDGKAVFRKGYGFANAEWEIPNAPDTKFRLGSITKQFTAVAILQLAGQGKLALEDPVSRHYPEAPAAWEKVTIHHLLTHTSGIPSYTSLPGFFRKQSRDPLTPVEVVQLTQDKPLQFAPGEKWEYNNTGYVLLGHLIERLSGQPYAEYMQAHLFGPLGMRDTGYDTYAAVLKRRAAGYLPDGRHAPYLDMSLPHAAGALYSTADDLLTWDRALHAGRVLPKAAFDRMVTPFKNDYAYGWNVTRKFGRRVTGHGGGINGFNTSFLRFPEEGVAVVVLSNRNSAVVDAMALDLAGLYFGETVAMPKARMEVTVAPSVLSGYVGEYELRPGFRIAVTQEGGQLMGQATNQPKLPLFASSETVFFLKAVEADVEFLRDQEGRATELILRQGGREVRGRRL